MSTRARPVWLVLAGIVSVQVGAALSKHQFEHASPTTMVWLRLAFSALVMLCVARPSLRGRSATDLAAVGAFGLTLATMNWAIYQSFARIPLGVAVTVEFLGPLLVALAFSRRALDLLWVVLAAAGVATLGFQASGVTLPGLLLAGLAGAAWAGYIRLSAVTGGRWPGLSGLTAASLVGALLVTPLVLVESGPGVPALPSEVVTTALLVALLSSVIPYSLELSALRSMPPRLFGILMSLEPAAAALVGLALLGERLALTDWLAVACVVTASAGATRSSTAHPDADHLAT